MKGKSLQMFLELFAVSFHCFFCHVSSQYYCFYSHPIFHRAVIIVNMKYNAHTTYVLFCFIYFVFFFCKCSPTIDSTSIQLSKLVTSRKRFGEMFRKLSENCRWIFKQLTRELYTDCQRINLELLKNCWENCCKIVGKLSENCQRTVRWRL